MLSNSPGETLSASVRPSTSFGNAEALQATASAAKPLASNTRFTTAASSWSPMQCAMPSREKLQRRAKSMISSTRVSRQ